MLIFLNGNNHIPLLESCQALLFLRVTADLQGYVQLAFHALGVRWASLRALLSQCVAQNIRTQHLKFIKLFISNEMQILNTGLFGLVTCLGNLMVPGSQFLHLFDIFCRSSTR
jgi:hypothetical protein